MMNLFSAERRQQTRFNTGFAHRDAAGGQHVLHDAAPADAGVPPSRQLRCAYLDRAGNFVPSEEAAAVVAHSLHMAHAESLATHGFGNGDSAHAADVARPPLDAEQSDASDMPSLAIIRAFVGDKVGALLASMGRGVARSAADAFPLTVRGQLIDVVMLGLRRRIPLNLVDVAAFGGALVRDLHACAGPQFQVGSYARVAVLADGQLALAPLPAPLPEATSPWNCATVVEW